MFDIEEFIIAVFLCIEQHLSSVLMTHPPRARGFAPGLSDSEVLTMEVVGEFLGHHADSEIWKYFRRHWRGWFPHLGHRTSFVRQAANLWNYKQLVHQQLLHELGANQSEFYRVDGFPVPVCGFKRASNAQLFKGCASYGHSEKLGTFYGFRGHLLITATGAVVGLSLSAANVDERDIVPELVVGLQGPLLGDKGYIRPALKTWLAEQDIRLLTPLKQKMAGYSSEFNRAVSRHRQLVETVIAHLCHWFEIETVRARDPWHLTSRIARKLLAHTIMVFLNRLHHRPALRFADIILD